MSHRRAGVSSQADLERDARPSAALHEAALRPFARDRLVRAHDWLRLNRSATACRAGRGRRRAEAVAVVDASGEYVGTVEARQLEEAVQEATPARTAGELAQDLSTLTPGQTLDQATTVLLHGGVPVDGRTLVGWLTHVDILRAYTSRSTSRSYFIP